MGCAKGSLLELTAMDTRTGLIHQLLPGETIEDLARRLGGKSSDFVPVEREADGVCTRCNGTGSVRRGLLSKKFKPCKCVL